MESVDQFVDRHDGDTINNGGVQCVAVANQYEQEVVKGGGDGWIPTPLTGYAIDWWRNFGNDSDYAEYVRVQPGDKAQKGDLAIWNHYGGYGLPHIALVLDDQGAGGLLCFTQNPGAARKELLTKKGLAGYLRPKKFISGANPAPVPTYNQGGKYSLSLQVPGYTSAADATNRRNSNSHVPAGEYFIFNKADGMVNVTRTAGQAGWWINPADNKIKPVVPSQAVYIVREGDNLSTIAANHKRSLAAVLRANPQIKNADLIHPGDRVVIPK